MSKTNASDKYFQWSNAEEGCNLGKNICSVLEGSMMLLKDQATWACVEAKPNKPLDPHSAKLDRRARG